MAKNRARANGRKLNLPVAANTVSGDPVVVGFLPGVALIDRDADGNATIDTYGVYHLSVKGINGGGNSAVAVGDRLYHTQADTPKLSKKDTGVYFGIALEPVVAGATTVIEVRIGHAGG